MRPDPKRSLAAARRGALSALTLGLLLAAAQAGAQPRPTDPSPARAGAPASAAPSAALGVVPPGASAAPPAVSAPLPAVLRVGVSGSPPFAILDKGPPSGLAVEIWKEAAGRMQVAYTLEAIPSVPEALHRVAEGKVDVVLGSLITTAEREKSVTFSQPFFHTSVAILARANESTWVDHLGAIFQRDFFVGVGVLFVVLALVGTLLWAAEHRANEQQFPKNVAHGIGNGIWLALVTLTTVGYGDRSPVTLAGRLIAGIWMLFAMIGGASLTASIATALTVNRLDQATLDTADKLKRHRVAVIPGTTGDFLAQRHGAILVQASSVEDGMAKLLAGEAEALVWDKPALQYLLREHQGPQKLVLSEATYDPHGYGFVLPHQSPLEHRLNIALLELEEAGITRGISTRMLGE